MSNATIYDDLVLRQLDPFFRRRMVPLLDGDHKPRFDIEVETVENILKSFHHKEDPLAGFFEDVTEHFKLSLQFEGFSTLTVRELITKIVDQWVKWVNPILAHPSSVIPVVFKDRLISGAVQMDVPLHGPEYKFLVSCNQYDRFLNVRKWNSDLYERLVSFDFIGVWNNSVVDELKLDDSIVWRFVELGSIISLVQNNVPNYEKPLPGTDLDAPNIPCYASFKNGKLQSLTIGHFQVIRHHPTIQKNMDWLRKQSVKNPSIEN